MHDILNAIGTSIGVIAAFITIYDKITTNKNE